MFEKDHVLLKWNLIEISRSDNTTGVATLTQFFDPLSPIASLAIDARHRQIVHAHLLRRGTHVRVLGPA